MSYAIGSLPRPKIAVTISPTLTAKLSPFQQSKLMSVGDKFEGDDADKSNTGLIVGGLALVAVAVFALRR
jgi:hypothetical protein